MIFVRFDTYFLGIMYWIDTSYDPLLTKLIEFKDKSKLYINTISFGNLILVIKNNDSKLLLLYPLDPIPKVYFFKKVVDKDKSNWELMKFDLKRIAEFKLIFSLTGISALAPYRVS